MERTPDPARTKLLSKHPAGGPAPAGSQPNRFARGEMVGLRYRIVRLVAVGGMGEVYRADDLDLGQPVALKILPARFAHDPVMVERLRSEVRIARPIVHPNVVRIFDIGEIDGVHFLTMEFVDGDDLATILARDGPPPFVRALDLAREICAGLAASHSHGVLHRDLKPGNVLVERTGRARLTDFGLAHAIGDALGPDATIGTPAYMSPEQLATGHTTIRSDIFSLGLLLFELFTGQAYFQTRALAELRRLHSLDPSVLLARGGVELETTVRQALSGCLQRDPACRPASVADVLAMFSSIANPPI